MINLTESGKWHETQGKLKQQLASLTNDDLLRKEGKKEELIGRLQIKLAITKEELKEIKSIRLSAIV